MSLDLYPKFPKYYRKAVSIVCRTGFICICTYWTKQEVVLKLIEDKEKILTVGNLYTKEGLEYIIRNAFLCPIIEHFIFAGHDKNNVEKAVRERFSNFNIESEYVDQFWDYFSKYMTFSTLKDLNKDISFISRRNEQWISEIVELPEPIQAPIKSYPSERCAFLVRDENLRRLWRRILTKINLFGFVKESEHDNSQKEIVGMVSILTGEAVMTPDMPNYEGIKDYLPQVISPEGDPNLSYTYGSRLHGEDQILLMIEELKKSRHSRRAICFTWRINKDKTSKNPPCLILVNCVVQGQELFMTCYFRSHDMYQAYCSNIFALKQLQKKIVKGINEIKEEEEEGENVSNSSSSPTLLKAGPIMILSNSAHVYERNFPLISDCHELDCNLDLRGYFSISVNHEENTLSVQFQDNIDNRVLFSTAGTNVQKLCDEVQPFISEISHALYVGRELQRAKNCLDNGTEFIQT